MSAPKSYSIGQALAFIAVVAAGLYILTSAVDDKWLLGLVVLWGVDQQ